MPEVRPLSVEPITGADVPAVAEFLHIEIGPEISAADWRRAMIPTWELEQPNYGYQLLEHGHIVGVHLALYSERTIDGQQRRICNLGTWCVTEEHRAAGLRLLRSLLRQKGYTFTDLTPNGNIVALNSRLGFVQLDTTRAMAPNIPWPVLSRNVRVVDAPNEIDELLHGQDRKIYRDHAEAAAAHHVVLTKGDQSCYVMYRCDYGRIKRRATFASILYVGDPELFRSCAPRLYRYLLLRRGIPVTLAETRVTGHRLPRSVVTEGPKKMYLSDDLDPAQIDDLYSELTCFEFQGRFPHHDAPKQGSAHIPEDAPGG